MKKNFYLIIVLTFFVLFVKANTQSVIWSETFEGDWTANWHADAGTWEAGIPTSGPNAAHSGDKCAATVLGGNYNTNVQSRLIRHNSFTVPSASENPRLRFWHWYSMGPNDYGKVQIKVDGTTDWVDISPSYINTGSDVWTYPSIDLSDYAGQSVQIAFYIYSNPFDVSTGWYIDDVEVLTGPMTFNNPEDWESGLGEWASESGTWEVGTPSGGPGEAYEGQQCAATVLNGNYATSVSSRL
ncbi:choice-of-anchor J domain-containing protein, partial [Mariniphaga sp.]|uniref:choice-of-anchor J domain-containing protein n=1 Tax=Mariniphaga sp. TaxID=1954475 RepID=UPI003569BF86